MLLLLTIKLAITALVFATGLSATREDLFWIWRHPPLLARSFLAMYILVPVVAIAMVLLFDLPRGTKIGLLFLSISAGAPLLPRKLIKLGGDAAFAFSIVIATSLAAVVTVPASLALLQPLLPVETDVDIGRLALTIIKTFLLPLAAGMLFRKFLPDWAEKLGDPIMRYAGLVLLGGAGILIISSFGQIMAVGLPSILAFAGLTLSALAIGHWLGGPDEAQRTSLAVSCATRHIGLALVLAADMKGPGTFPLIATYLFASSLVSIPYIRWRKRLSTSLILNKQ
jgi:predicted Na+-dependent transporter